MNIIRHLGIDIGSTTVKVVLVNPETQEIEYSAYRRHHARQTQTLRDILEELSAQLHPDTTFFAAVCGSGGKPVAEAMGIPYIQEVVANAVAVQTLYPQTRTAIELGGQDAKVIFFQYDQARQQLVTDDMRMNGSCAGGTGAFIDEIAALLQVPPEEFDALAVRGTCAYDISGRCGVFAKTDIQPLLLQGAKKEDIALSTFHAIAKQTIGGLSQGLELKAPIIFEGGPLTFQPTLIRVFAEYLHLSDSDIVLPEHPEIIVAYGTALAAAQFLSPDSGETGADFQTLCGRLQHYCQNQAEETSGQGQPLFASPQARADFFARHNAELMALSPAQPVGQVLRVYIGIDSGSTTSKLVLLDEQERVIDQFYANNHGAPLDVLQQGLIGLYEKYRQQNIRLEVLGLGSTGYGEQLAAEAFGADYHTVETVAHAEGCKKYIPDATFLLDIGGQDMKAIWLDDGIITNILLNEACSSGCGSFLENFADTLGIPVHQIADTAFSARNPAQLGSRCTVFMNSTIIHEQRCGKKEDDIMAGLCRSIVENVFTKVVRISNPAQLGSRIVVQGGTFRNFAVLRALEEYLCTDVTLAPYPGEMGAIGAALLTKRAQEQRQQPSRFIGFDALKTFSYQTTTGLRCPHCENHCIRTRLQFSTGKVWITGNRCERGGEITAGDKSVPHASGVHSAPQNLFDYRRQLLLKQYPCQPVSGEKHQVIGIPLVLEFWDSLPFWTTFFHALGYRTRISRGGTKRYYESGLRYVASDTICFPAKLVHGHILELAEQKTDRIFFPYVMHMPPEGTDKLSPYVCSIVQGYPMVVRNSQDPEKDGNLVYDTPIFHWFTEKNRKQQVCRYAQQTLGATQSEAEAAFSQADAALKQFREDLKRKGQEVLDQVKAENAFAVVLAGRPYHCDPFVNHDIAKLFTKQGISVLTVDSLPDLQQVDLHNTRAEITNNFHTRMLSAAVLAAKNPNLEYAQIVSFGCGHDAILSDEIIRIMDEISGKPPLILKIDESNAAGALSIRVQSFIESIQIRRKQMTPIPARALESAYPVQFYKKDKKVRTLLIPNISEEVSILLDAILQKEGFRAKTIPVGGPNQIHIGKKYCHNDICFPCQMIIGEIIDELQQGGYAQDEVAVAMVKFQCDCRLSHYSALLRKALDSAGFDKVPVITTDFNDSKKCQPGVFLLGLSAAVSAVWVFIMLDILTDLVRKIRPYECNPGQTDAVYRQCVENLARGIRQGIGPAKKAFSDAIDLLSSIPWDRSTLKPRVLVTGELLVTYHPGSNFHIEQYLEKNGMETVFPRVTDQLRKDFLASLYEIKDFKASIFPYPYIVNYVFDSTQQKLERIAAKHPLYEEALRPNDIYKEVEHVIPVTLSCGEGWLMAAEIAHYAAKGMRSFVILQPFGCLPNHICGRGTIKRLKDDYPGIQILPLDLDPDTSYANVENRLQMLIMNERKTQTASEPPVA